MLKETVMSVVGGSHLAWVAQRVATGTMVLFGEAGEGGNEYAILHVISEKALPIHIEAYNQDCLVAFCTLRK